MIISVPVQIAVFPLLFSPPMDDIALHVSVAGLYRAHGPFPQMIISVPVQTAEWFLLAEGVFPFIVVGDQ
jgi:hypothetical protein